MQPDTAGTWIAGAPFEPTKGWLGVRLSVTSSSASVALVGNGPMVTISNSGSVAACVTVGTSTVVATTNHYEILPGTKEVVALTDPTETWIAAITVTGSTSLQITRGIGT